MAAVQPEPWPAGATNEVDAIESWIMSDEFPCLGARSALRQGSATVSVFGDLGSWSSAASLLQQLERFAAGWSPGAGFGTFLAAFRGPEIDDERHFERLLWRQLRRVHALDRHEWDPSVSMDPADHHFGFSAAGTAFFVVGMHPRASRVGRRAPLPLLAFNPHEQFQRLRDEGRFERFRDAIRRRDKQIAGSTNPMLADHGEASEARQYSGRLLEEDWKAPWPLPHADR